MSSNLLTESLQASVTLETNKKQLLRAASYLTIAQSAFSRYAEWKRNADNYLQSWRNMEAWTFINTKQQAEKRAADALAAYHRCMNSYRKILFTLFTNKN